MMYTYIPTGIKRELVRFGMDCDQKGYGVGIGEVIGGASGMGLDRICEVGDRTSEGQAAGVYEAGFTVGVSGKEGSQE